MTDFRIGFQVDTAGADQYVAAQQRIVTANRETAASSKEIASAQKGLDDALKAGVINQQQYNAGIASSTQQFDKLSQAARQHGMALDQYSQVLAKTPGALKQLEQGTVSLANTQRQSSGLVGDLISGLTNWGGATQRTTGNIREHTASLFNLHNITTEYRHGVHALHPELAQMGIHMGALTQFSSAARGGIVALAGALTGTLFVALEMAGEKAQALRHEFDLLYGSKSNDMFRTLEDGSKRLGMTVDQLAPAMDAAYRSFYGSGFEKAQAALDTLYQKGFRFLNNEAGRDRAEQYAQRLGMNEDLKGLAEFYAQVGGNAYDALRKSREFFTGFSTDSKALAALAPQVTLEVAHMFEATGIGSEKAAKATDDFIKGLRKGFGTAELEKLPKDLQKMLADLFVGPGDNSIQEFGARLEKLKLPMDAILRAFVLLRPQIESFKIPETVRTSWDQLTASIDNAFQSAAQQAGFTGISGGIDTITLKVRELDEAIKQGKGWEKLEEMARNAWTNISTFFSSPRVKKDVDTALDAIGTAAGIAFEKIGASAADAFLQGIKARLFAQTDSVIAEYSDYLLSKVSFGVLGSKGIVNQVNQSNQEASTRFQQRLENEGRTKTAPFSGAEWGDLTKWEELTEAEKKAELTTNALSKALAGTSLTTAEEEATVTTDNLSKALAQVTSLGGDVDAGLGSVDKTFSMLRTNAEETGTALDTLARSEEQLASASSSAAATISSAVQSILAAAQQAQQAASSGGGGDGISAPLGDSSAADLGDNQYGGVYQIGHPGSGAADSIPLKAMITPGEIAAIIPPDKVTPGLMSMLKQVIGKSPIQVGPSGQRLGAQAEGSISEGMTQAQIQALTAQIAAQSTAGSAAAAAAAASASSAGGLTPQQIYQGLVANGWVPSGGQDAAGLQWFMDPSSGELVQFDLITGQEVKRQGAVTSRSASGGGGGAGSDPFADANKRRQEQDKQGQGGGGGQGGNEPPGMPSYVSRESSNRSDHSSSDDLSSRQGVSYGASTYVSSLLYGPRSGMYLGRDVTAPGSRSATPENLKESGSDSLDYGAQQFDFSREMISEMDRQYAAAQEVAPFSDQEWMAATYQMPVDYPDFTTAEYQQAVQDVSNEIQQELYSSDSGYYDGGGDYSGGYDFVPDYYERTGDIFRFASGGTVIGTPVPNKIAAPPFYNLSASLNRAMGGKETQVQGTPLTNAQVQAALAQIAAIQSQQQTAAAGSTTGGVRSSLPRPSGTTASSSGAQGGGVTFGGTKGLGGDSNKGGDLKWPGNPRDEIDPELSRAAKTASGSGKGGKADQGPGGNQFDDGKSRAAQSKTVSLKDQMNAELDRLINQGRGITYAPGQSPQDKARRMPEDEYGRTGEVAPFSDQEWQEMMMYDPMAEMAQEAYDAAQEQYQEELQAQEVAMYGERDLDYGQSSYQFPDYSADYSSGDSGQGYYSGEGDYSSGYDFVPNYYEASGDIFQTGGGFSRAMEDRRREKGMDFEDQQLAEARAAIAETIAAAGAGPTDNFYFDPLSGLAMSRDYAGSALARSAGIDAITSTPDPQAIVGMYADAERQNTDIFAEQNADYTGSMSSSPFQQAFPDLSGVDAGDWMGGWWNSPTTDYGYNADGAPYADAGEFASGGMMTVPPLGSGVDSVRMSFLGTPGETFVGVPPGQGASRTRLMASVGTSGGGDSGGANVQRMQRFGGGGFAPLSPVMPAPSDTSVGSPTDSVPQQRVGGVAEGVRELNVTINTPDIASFQAMSRASYLRKLAGA